MNTMQRVCSVHTGNLILVNVAHPLRGDAADTPLAPVGGTQSGVYLERRAAALLEQLMHTLSGWREIVPVSGWRSGAEQQRIWDESLRENGADFTRSYVAVPGCSEHQSGLAIDLGLRREEVDFIRPYFPDEGICREFRRRAPSFGFVLRYPAGKEHITGIAHEPWHFRYLGVPHAEIMSAHGLTLEEYHAFLKDFPYGGPPLRFARARFACAVSFLPHTDAAQLPELAARARTLVSGNNADGYVLTTWTQEGAEG